MIRFVFVGAEKAVERRLVTLAVEVVVKVRGFKDCSVTSVVGDFENEIVGGVEVGTFISVVEICTLAVEVGALTSVEVESIVVESCTSVIVVDFSNATVGGLVELIEVGTLTSVVNCDTVVVEAAPVDDTVVYGI